MQNVCQRLEDLYFLPIGGTAMASLAGLLLAAGHRVRGVDAQLYPPMSTLLEELGIPVRLGWDPDRIPEHVDRVIIGNAVPRTNPEVQAVLARGLPYLSQAEAVARYLLDRRRSLVVAGTHGKTTTTAMLAWIIEQCGLDPTVLVGGLLPWSRRSFRFGNGPWLVVEGDEYNTAFFDRRPKMVHYRPHILLLGPVEHDHADIYPDLDAVLAAFRAGVAQVPPEGRVVVNAESPNALAAAAEAASPVLRVGSIPEADAYLQVRALEPETSRAHLDLGGRKVDLAISLPGRHNLENAALAVVAAAEAGLDPDAAAAALASFPGVARRLEVVGAAGGVTVVDDFAHHPTALAATVAACRQRWPRRRLVVAYEPRSLTAGRAGLEKAYTAALAEVDVALIAPVYHRARLAPGELLDRHRIAADLHRAGVVALVSADDGDPVALLLPHIRRGDVVVGCSSGDFGGFHRRLLAALAGER